MALYYSLRAAADGLAVLPTNLLTYYATTALALVHLWTCALVDLQHNLR